MFHTVFCVDERRTNGRDLANWIMDASIFDDIPRFEPPFEDLGRADWHTLNVIYDDDKRPVQLIRIAGPKVDDHVRDLITELAERCPKPQPDLVARLRKTSQVYSIEFDELGATDDVWEMLDVVEARLARELDGVTYSDDEGVFDSHNQAICTFG